MVRDSVNQMYKTHDSQSPPSPGGPIYTGNNPKVMTTDECHERVRQLHE